MSAATNIKRQLARMRAYTADADRLAVACPDISAWCVVEHLDHMAKVSTSIFRRIEKGEPLPATIKPLSLLGRLVMLVGRIPRGRGRAPEKLHGTRVDATTLATSLDETERMLERLDLTKNSRTLLVQHPKFGGLTPAQSMRFVVIHNEHHLRIIEDILRAPR